MNDNKVMMRAADNIRILAAAMVEKAKSGHPGGAMGGADHDVIPGSSQADDIIAAQEVGVLGVVAENGCSKNIGSE
jgi:hypothetical protein